MAEFNPDDIQMETFEDTSTPPTEFKPNRLNALGVALTQDNLAGTVYNMFDDFKDSTRFDYDPSFKVSDRLDLFQNVDSAYWDEMQGAKSEAHLMHLAKEYGDYSKSAQYLDSLGVEGMAYRLASVFADVPLISALQKVRGVGKAAVFLDKLNDSYAGRALIAGTIEGAFEGVKQVTSPVERTELDMLMAVGVGGLVGGLYKARGFDAESADAVASPVREAINEVGATGVKGEKTQAWVSDKQFNVTAAFQGSQSPTMRSIGEQLFNDVLNPTLGDFKAIEIRDNVKYAIDNAFSLNFDPLYMEFMEKMYGKKFAMLNRLNIQKQEEFYNLMGDMYYGRNNPLIDSMDDAYKAKVDKAFQKMSEDSYDIMKRNGHTKFNDGSIEKTDDYLPLRWAKDKIQQLNREGVFKKSDFKKAVLDGLQKKFQTLGIQVDAKSLEKAAKKFTDTMYRQDIKVGEKGYITQDNAMKKALQELQEYLELTDEEVALLKQSMDKADEAGERGTASATKRRTPLDLEGSYTTKDGFEIKLSDYIDTNVQGLWHHYSHSMGGDTALRRMNVNSRKELANLRNKVEKELKEANGGLLSKEAETELANFDQTIAHLLGMTAKDGAADDIWKATRMLNNLTRASKLGATWFAMSAELARVSHRIGVKNLVKSMPSLKQVINAYRGKDFDAVYRELQLHEALGGELNQMVSIAKYEDLLAGQAQGTARFLDKAERFSDVANEATMLAGGVKSGTSMLEYWHAIGARVKMMDMARKGMDDKAYRFFEQYGFDREMADKIAGQMNKFASKDPNYPLLNLDEWEDGLGHAWSLGVRRQSYELIQKTNFGDNIAARSITGNKMVGDTVLGSLSMNLKNYMVVAYNKQLSKGIVNLAKGGKDRMDVMGNWTYQTAFALVSYTAKQYMLHGNDQKKLDEALSWERIAANTFGMTTFASFLPSAIDVVAEPLMDEPLFNVYSRGQPAGLPTIAPMQFLSDAATGAVGVGKLISPWADASEGELKKAFNSLPLGNAMFVKQLTGEMAEALAEDSGSRGWY
jgi:hypothetical protein